MNKNSIFKWLRYYDLCYILDWYNNIIPSYQNLLWCSVFSVFHGPIIFSSLVVTLGVQNLTTEDRNIKMLIQYTTFINNISVSSNKIMIEFQEKEFGLLVLVGLQHTSHSLALSHYCLLWTLWAAGFLPWPDSHLLRRPGHRRLPCGVHIDK